MKLGFDDAKKVGELVRAGKVKEVRELLRWKKEHGVNRTVYHECDKKPDHIVIYSDLNRPWVEFDTNKSNTSTVGIENCEYCGARLEEE